MAVTVIFLYNRNKTKRAAKELRVTNSTITVGAKTTGTRAVRLNPLLLFQTDESGKSMVKMIPKEYESLTNHN